MTYFQVNFVSDRHVKRVDFRVFDDIFQCNIDRACATHSARIFCAFFTCCNEKRENCEQAIPKIDDFYVVADSFSQITPAAIVQKLINLLYVSWSWSVRSRMASVTRTFGLHKRLTGPDNNITKMDSHTLIVHLCNVCRANVHRPEHFLLSQFSSPSDRGFLTLRKLSSSMECCYCLGEICGVFNTVKVHQSLLGYSPNKPLSVLTWRLW